MGGFNTGIWEVQVCIHIYFLYCIYEDMLLYNRHSNRYKIDKMLEYMLNICVLIQLLESACLFVSDKICCIVYSQCNHHDTIVIMMTITIHHVLCDHHYSCMMR